MSRLNEKTSSLLFSAFIALTFVSPCFADDGPAPGPALELRQKLYDRIQQARSQGIGIGGYMQAFRAVEEQAKSGDSADKIGSRIDSIHAAINGQMDKAKLLKTQKPIPPQGSQITGSDPIAQPSASKLPGPPGPGGGAPSGDMLDKIKNKLGGKFDNIPDSIKERIMNDPSMIDKIKARTGMGGDAPAGPPGGAPAGGPPGGPPGGQPAQ